MTERSDSFPVPGDLFQDRYTVERIIGVGGFSRVYLATQNDLGRKVALKIMRPVSKLDADGNKTPASLASLDDRFLQEARVVANLRGPHTVTVHDHGRTDDGHLFMVLEYVDGEPLSTLIKDLGALPPNRVRKILRQTLESLQEAHALGLLHRDIKPANIMVYDHLGKPDNVKVLDFGIAKVVGPQIDVSNHDDLTQSGSLLGTPRYMSPEQLRGHELTPATDIYSLGLVAYEMLMGKKAIESHSSVMIIGAQLDPNSFELPDDLSIPLRLRAIVNRMLSKELSERYATTSEVLADLDEMETGPLTALPGRDPMFTPMENLPDLSDSLEIVDIQQLDFPADNAPSDRGKRFMLGGVLAVFALVLVFVGINMLPSSSDDEDAPTPGQLEVAEASEPPEDVAAEPVREADADSQPSEPEEMAPTEMVVSTIPSAAEIYVNGESRGSSPLTLPAAELKFPAKIRAVAKGGGERLTVVDRVVPHVEIDLSMVVTAAEPTPKPKPKIVRKTRPRGTSKSSDNKPKPTVEPEETQKKLTLPALDY